MTKGRSLTAHDVFTPSSFPEHNYVARDGDDLEDKLRFALKTKGQIVSLSGPSKSGKTVLVEKVVGMEKLVTVVGAGVHAPDDIWTRVLDWIDAPADVTDGKSGQLRAGARVGGKTETDIIVASGEASGDLRTDFTRRTTGTERKARRGMEQVIEELGGSDLVVLVDDFHYMPREVQAEVAKQLKEAARRGAARREARHRRRPPPGPTTSSVQTPSCEDASRSSTWATGVPAIWRGSRRAASTR